MQVIFIKKDKAQQIAYGSVLSPNLFDMDTDILTQNQVIKDGAHAWLSTSRKMNLYHRHALEEYQSYPVESYITCCDLVVKDDDFVACYPMRYTDENGREILDIYTCGAVVNKETNLIKEFELVLFQSGVLNEAKDNFISKDGASVEYIPMGTWMLVTKVADKDLWAMIEDGRILGYSVEGKAKKQTIELDIDKEQKIYIEFFTKDGVV